MKTTTIFGLFALMLVGVVAVAGSVSAFGARMWQIPEDRQALQTAIENNDYSSWRTLMENQITEDNFNNLVEMHNNMTVRRESEQAIRDAIDSGDYEAYVSAVGSVTTAEPINESDFEKLVELHTARQNGDFETASQLKEELGSLDIPGEFGPGGFGPGEFGMGHGGRGHGFNMGEI